MTVSQINLVLTKVLNYGKKVAVKRSKSLACLYVKKYIFPELPAKSFLRSDTHSQQRNGLDVQSFKKPLNS